jgi:hypothetical protein
MKRKLIFGFFNIHNFTLYNTLQTYIMKDRMDISYIVYTVSSINPFGSQWVIFSSEKTANISVLKELDTTYCFILLLKWQNCRGITYLAANTCLALHLKVLDWPS